MRRSASFALIAASVLLGTAAFAATTNTHSRKHHYTHNHNMLNPQPLPPIVRLNNHTMLNPQPLPPIVQSNNHTMLNPQPLPPKANGQTGTPPPHTGGPTPQ
jgi:hypothetical protein